LKEDSLISVVMPCYNEGKLAVDHAIKVQNFLNQLKWNYELAICDDGTKDGSEKLIDTLQDSGILVFHYPNGPSRRENLSRCLQELNGSILIYMDIDLSTDLAYLPDIVNPLLQEECDIAIGSRYQKGAKVNREFSRFLYSRLYNGTIRALLGSKVLDHQCGFKAFKKKVFHSLAASAGYDELRQRGWFWDAEILIRAQREGYSIREVPVRWTAAKKSSFDFYRELKVIPYMLKFRKQIG
jgi:glycosyltransferase involved in cell wall biosynthesis